MRIRTRNTLFGQNILFGNFNANFPNSTIEIQGTQLDRADFVRDEYEILEASNAEIVSLKQDSFMNSSRSVFVLGAGFSRYLSDKMPLTSDLNQILADPEIAAALTNLQIHTASYNFEVLLSFLLGDLAWKRLDETYGYKALYENILTKLIKQIRLAEIDALKSIKGQDFARLFQFWLTNQSGLITFNYDTLIERIFMLLFHQKILPVDIQGNSLWKLPIMSVMLRDGTSIMAGSQFPDLYSPTLIKLHGSINWFMHRQSDVFTGQLYYDAHFVNDPGHSEINRRDLANFMIPPIIEKTYMNSTPIIRSLWQNARAHLKNSNRIYLMGYLIPISDTHVEYLFHASDITAKEIFVINRVDRAAISKEKLRLTEYFQRFGVTPNVDYVRDTNPIQEFVQTELVP